MAIATVTGQIHSIQTLGTLDGPGVRFVAFLQGCNLRCGCCHNPDTWAMTDAKSYTAEALVACAERYRSYFGKDGGVTLSGGEPLLQAAFAHAFFSLSHEKGMHTCLDTSGSIWNQEVEALLMETDRVLLDVKYANESDYRNYVGCSIEPPLRFLDVLNERGIPTTLRRVIIPGLNDGEEDVRSLAELKRSHPCVDAIELLAFQKICTVKYEEMGIPFRFASYPTPTDVEMKRLNEKLNEYLQA